MIAETEKQEGYTWLWCDSTPQTMDFTPQTVDFTPQTMDFAPQTMDVRGSIMLVPLALVVLGWSMLDCFLACGCNKNYEYVLSALYIHAGD